MLEWPLICICRIFHFYFQKIVLRKLKITCRRHSKQSSLLVPLQDDLSTLHSLACKMETLGLNQTRRLSQSVLHSINCPCGKPGVSTDTLLSHGSVGS